MLQLKNYNFNDSLLNLKRLNRVFPDFYNFKKYNLKDHKDKIGYTFFDTMLLENNQIGEDYAFCERVKSIGEKVYIDPTINLIHHGGNINFYSTFD